MFLLQRSSNAAQSLCDLIRLSRDHMSQLQENADQDPLLDAVQRWVLLYCVVQPSVNRLLRRFCQIEYTVSSLLFFFAKLLHTKPKHANGELSRKPREMTGKIKRLWTLLFCLGTTKLSR